jgi:hypothetical protein
LFDKIVLTLKINWSSPNDSWKDQSQDNDYSPRGESALYNLNFNFIYAISIN